MGTVYVLRPNLPVSEEVKHMLPRGDEDTLSGIGKLYLKKIP